MVVIGQLQRYVKDGNKNRLREQDVYRIVTTFNEQITDDPKYARFAWAASNPGVNLVNGAGLPPFPFDSSDPLFYATGKQKKLNN